MFARSPSSLPAFPHGGRWVRLLFASAAVAATALLAAHVARLLAGWSVEAVPAMAAGLLLGALAADGATGCVHWACDSFGSAAGRGPLAALIASFREHHRNPEAMLEGDWVTVNGEAATASCLGLAVLSWPDITEILAARPELHAAAISFVSLAGAANQLHRWAHSTTVPKAVGWLQRAGLVLSPARHARHHCGAHNRAYCISLGWLNAPLDRVRFWRGCERVVETLTGHKPREDAAEGSLWKS